MLVAVSLGRGVSTLCVGSVVLLASNSGLYEDYIGLSRVVFILSAILRIFLYVNGYLGRCFEDRLHSSF